MSMSKLGLYAAVLLPSRLSGFGTVIPDLRSSLQIQTDLEDFRSTGSIRLLQRNVYRFKRAIFIGMRISNWKVRKVH
jgi:hypothetical protein